MVWNRPQINLYELSSGAKYRSTASNNLISIKSPPLENCLVSCRQGLFFILKLLKPSFLSKIEEIIWDFNLNTA